MARDRSSKGTRPPVVISVIASGMEVVGDCETETTVRIEGTVEGSIRAREAVLIGKDGVVTGDITTQSAVVAGRFSGTLLAESRVELQATCRVEGHIHTPRMQVEEGAILDGSVDMRSDGIPRSPDRAQAVAART